MKERFLLAVSWAALAWALFICRALYVELVVDGRSIGRVLGSADGWVAFISPAVWLVLWIVTGSPRILPWRKVEQDDEKSLNNSRFLCQIGAGWV